MKVSIIGFGLMGGSIALNLKLVNPSVVIVAFDPDESNLDYGLTHGFCDVPRGTLTEDVAGSHYVVLATHLDAFEGISRSLVQLLRGDELVMDVGSVKGWVVERVKPIFDEAGVPFVACHPIAGTEKSGAMNAVKGLFDGAKCIITPWHNSEEDIIKARVFWELLGARVELLDPYTHDAIFSQVSHLPHLIAYALVDYVLKMDEGAALSFAGGGFRDFTRIAASSPDMWVEIFKKNRDAVLRDLESFIRVLSDYRALLEAGDWERLRSVFSEVARTRGSMRF